MPKKVDFKIYGIKIHINSRHVPLLKLLMRKYEFGWDEGTGLPLLDYVTHDEISRTYPDSDAQQRRDLVKALRKQLESESPLL